MNKLMAALIAGALAMVPMTAVLAQDKAPAKTEAKMDCKAVEAKSADCKKSGATTDECKKAAAATTECKKAEPKKRKGGC